MRVYGVDAREIARGIQAAVDAMRRGIPKSFLRLRESHERLEATAGQAEAGLEGALAQIKVETGEILVGAILDVFKGGICNLSRHSGLPAALLADLAYERGVNQEFLAEGPLSGTPMVTLPGRVRPLVRLDPDYYATDPHFLRDSTYRAIQRGLLARDNDYRDTWGKRQAAMCEDAFGHVFKTQLAGAEILQSVYHRDVDTKNWVEGDVLILLDDTLIQVEAKAGVMAMQSPATNFANHVRVIQDLVVKAYRQSDRFLRYLASADEVPLYTLQDGAYRKIKTIRFADYRTVLPIGLTVEAFTPFSAMCKHLPEIEPVLGRFPFVSMSVDDLFVLTKILPTTGQLFHYLEVRQALGREKQVMLFDELDHLGSYLGNNRFDMSVRDMVENRGADHILAAGSSEVVDNYFAVDDWAKSPPPGQKLPRRYQDLLIALGQTAEPGWLEGNSFLRDLGSEARTDLDNQLRAAIKRLRRGPIARFILKGEQDLMVSVCPLRGNGDKDLIDRAKSLTLAVDKPDAYTVEVRVKPTGAIAQARARKIARPKAGDPDFKRLQRDAGNIRMAVARVQLGAENILVRGSGPESRR